MQIGGSGQCVACAALRFGARPPHHHRGVPKRSVHGQRWLAPHVAAVHIGLAEVVAVIGADDNCSVVPTLGGIELIHHPAEPVIDHRQLAAVLGADLARFVGREHAIGERTNFVWRPDEIGALPIGVVHRCPRLGCVEWFVRIELVDPQEEPLARGAVMRSVIAQPACGGGHGARPWEVVFGHEVATRVVVMGVAAAIAWRTNPRRVGTGLPRIAFVATLVLPRREIAVIVLATGLEKMWVIGDQLRDNARTPQRGSDCFFP